MRRFWTTIAAIALVAFCVGVGWLMPSGFRALAAMIPGVQGGMTTYGGQWIDKDGTTKIGGSMSLVPSGTFDETVLTTTVSASPATILNLNPTGRRTALFIEVNTTSLTVTCTDDGSVPALWTAPGITVSGQGAAINYKDIGVVPAGAIKCIASGAGSISVRAL